MTTHNQPPPDPGPGNPSAPPIGLSPFQPSGYPDTDTTSSAPAAAPGPAPRAVTAPTMPALPPGPPRLMPRINRQIAITVTTVIVLLLAAGAVLAVTSTTPPPDTPVRALFTALDHHDPGGLQTLDVCDNSPLCETGALTTGYQEPRHLHIDTPDRSSGDDTTVTVHYDIDTTHHTDQIRLTRHRTGLLGHAWRITTPPGATLQIHSTYWDTTHLAATDIPLHPATDPGNTPDGFWAPPGRYTLTTRDDPVVTATHLDLTIAGDTPPPALDLTPTTRPDLVQQVDQQIRARIDQCAAQHTPHPTVGTSPLDFNTCPIRDDPPYTTVDSPHWTIRNYPTVALHINDDATITVDTTTPGEADLTYRWTLDIVTPQRWTTVTTTIPITIGGHLELDHNTPTWKP